MVTVYVLFSIAAFYRYLFASTFQPVVARTMGINVKVIHYFLMLLLSFAVVASLRTVGVILVVAMLITPASTALLLTKRLPRVVLLAGGIGLVASVAGLLVSIAFDTTPGPAMAVIATLIYGLAVLFAPERGIVFRRLRRRRLQRRIQLEDALKQAYRLQERHQLTLDALDERVGYSLSTLQTHLGTLRNRGLLDKKELQLTPHGEAIAQKLIRAHRLW